MILVSAGVKYSSKQNRINAARERALNQYRKDNGKFSRVKVAEKKVVTYHNKRIKVNEVDRSYYITV